MPTKPKPKFTAWSYSRWRDHVACPAYSKYRHIDRLPEPKGPALVRGGQVDQEANDYVSAKGRPRLPESLSLFAKEFKELRKLGAQAQARWAVDRSWKIVDFFAPTAWGRMVLDMHYLSGRAVHVVDNKTGRVYPENEEQLELYAIPALLAYPQAREARTALWYLDHGEIRGERTYARAKLPALIKAWEKRLVPMLTDKAFPPKPGDACRWCHFRKSNGGPCRFG